MRYTPAAGTVGEFPQQIRIVFLDFQKDVLAHFRLCAQQAINSLSASVKGAPRRLGFQLFSDLVEKHVNQAMPEYPRVLLKKPCHSPSERFDARWFLNSASAARFAATA